MSGEDVEFLIALDRLVARYGPRSVIRVAELLRDPKRAEELAITLDAAAARARRSRPRPKSKDRRDERVGMAVLRQLRMSDPEKHDLLAEIRSQLLAGGVLPSMGEIRRFALMHDFSIGRASSRTAAIAPLLRALSDLPTEEIRSLYESIAQPDSGDRSLDRWREVIVRQQPPGPDSGQSKL